VDDLKKFHPGEAAMTPFDDAVIASAPKPVPAAETGRAKFEVPLWLRKYPVAHPDHIQGLEQDAAVNEFGMKMPREKAEAEAYRKYQGQQHEQAAHHHLVGAAAARAAGDAESAAKHGMMYDMHVKALGHEPVGAVPPSILNAGPSKLYRFKPHRGDVFALNPVHAGDHGQVSSSAPPQLGKAEAELLAAIGVAAQVLAKAERVKCSRCGKSKKVGDTHLLSRGRVCTTCADKDKPTDDALTIDKLKGAVEKGEVVGKIGNPAGAKPQPKGRKQGYNDIALAPARRFARDNGLPDQLAGKLDEDGNKVKKSVNDWAKAELKQRKGSCRCESYNFPHRHGGGRCKSSG
jgi:hypothetical protein